MVHVQAWREAYGGLLPQRFYDDAERERREVMWSGLLAGADAGHRIRVARREGRIVGFVRHGPAAEHHGTGRSARSSYTRSTCCPVVSATVLVKLSLTRLSADGQRSSG